MSHPRRHVKAVKQSEFIAPAFHSYLRQPAKECNGFAESVGMVGQDGGRTDRGCPGAESSRCAGFADELAKQDAIPQRSGNSIAGPNQFPSRLLFFIGRKYHIPSLQTGRSLKSRRAVGQGFHGLSEGGAADA